MELHFTGTGAAYYPRLGSNAAFFVKNNHLFMIDCGESTFRKMEARDEIRTCDKITVFITHLHADHIGTLKRLCEYIPPEMRNRVYCMHFGGDFMSQIKEAGFQVVTSV